LVVQTARSFSGVSDISVNWIAVTRSARRQHLRWAALALTAGVACACALVLVLDSHEMALIGGLLAMSLAALVLHVIPESVMTHCWCVNHDGRVSIRWAVGAETSDEVNPAFVSSFLVVLRQGRRTLQVWRDATPAPAFRRLAVAVRWRVARDFSVADGDLTDAADRT
jgi:hypothetical protein